MKNSFLKKWLIANVVLVLLAAVGIYVLVGEYEKSKSEYNKKVSSIEMFGSEKIYPNAINFDLKQDQLNENKRKLGEVNKDFALYAKGSEVKRNFTAFFEGQIKAIKSYLTEKEVKYDQALLFGFEDYANQAVKNEAKDDVSYCLQGIEWFFKLTGDVGIDEVLSVSRQPFDFEIKNKKRRSKSNLSTYRFEIVLKSKEAEIRELMNKLISDKGFFVNIASYKLQSSLKNPVDFSSEETSIKRSRSFDNVDSAIIEDQVDIIKVLGDEDLYLALELEFVRIK